MSVISKVLGIPYGKFYRWIKENISDFKDQETQEKLHHNDIPSKNGDVSKTVKVPIFRQDQMGESMAIDEKHLNGMFHTVLTNSKTSKVALFCSSIHPVDLQKCFKKFDELDRIKFITRDLSSTFKKVANTHFPNAVHIADKFHIIRYAIDAVQSLRIRLKQQALQQQRKEQSRHEQNYKDSKNPDFIGPKMNIKKNYKAHRIENGETLPELLTRSRYVCSIHNENWNEYQQRRANILFKYFPQLKKVYDVILEFRDWYKVKPTQYEPFINEKTLGNWLDHAEMSNVMELRNFRKLVENHCDEILNYHKYGHRTNAIAESINAKINDAKRKNKGTRDVDFFNLRLSYII
jgi:transposase